MTVLESVKDFSLVGIGNLSKAQEGTVGSAPSYLLVPLKGA